MTLESLAASIDSAVIHHHYPQGGGFSPDGGRLWIKGNTIYWSTGEVTEIKPPVGDWPSYVMRYMPLEECEDYSAWTPEHRAAVLAENQAKWAENDRRRKERIALRESLVAIAKTKLTKEEYDAVFDEGFVEGRGYE